MLFYVVSHLLIGYSCVAAFILGRGVVAGAAVGGLGALAYYGLGLSSQTGALEQSL